MYTLVSLLVFSTDSSAVKWQIKEGCESNDTVLAQHLLLPAGHPLSCAAKQELWGLGSVFAWGQCNGSRIQIGTGTTSQECTSSVKAKDGFHREIIFPETLKEGDCKCTENGVFFNAFHCVETTHIEDAYLTQYAMPSVEETPIPHSSTDAGFAVSYILIFTFGFLVLLTFMS